MLEDPIGYNDAVVGFFRRKYAKQIEAVFSAIQQRADPDLSPWLVKSLSIVPQRVIERHLFPVFAAASASGGITEYHLAFCIAFVRVVSLPVLRIDQLIDRPVNVRAEGHNDNQTYFTTLLSSLCLLHDGFLEFCKFRNMQEILEVILLNYRRLYSSLYREMTRRYSLECLSHPDKSLRWIFHSPFSPLTCMYFSTTVQASILLNLKEVDPDVKRLTERFGKLRQLCDQISDIEEDIAIGNVTIPVLYALLEDRDSLASMIKTLWTEIKSGESVIDNSTLSSRTDQIKGRVQELGGFNRAYDLAKRWYGQAAKLISKCNEKPGIGIEIVLLFRLKRAYLERLKLNNWTDIPNYY